MAVTDTLYETRASTAPRATSTLQRQPGSERRSSPEAGESLANALGWFSIGLGAAELLIPKRLGRLTGIHDHHKLTRFMGLREIGAGIAVLAQDHPVAGMRARVAGDALDLAALGAALASDKSQRGRVLGATAAVAGVTALDIICERRLSGAGEQQGVHFVEVTFVDRSPEECYRFWRDFENLPRFMEHLKSVRVTGDNRSHWIAKAPAGMEAAWDAEITDDRPNESISWRSLPGSDINNAGSVRFERAAGDRGTIIRVEITYDSPLGKAGSLIAKLFGEEPGQQTRGDLHRFKQLIETGEIPTTKGQPNGKGAA